MRPAAPSHAATRVQPDSSGPAASASLARRPSPANPTCAPDTWAVMCWTPSSRPGRRGLGPDPPNRTYCAPTSARRVNKMCPRSNRNTGPRVQAKLRVCPAVTGLAVALIPQPDHRGTRSRLGPRTNLDGAVLGSMVAALLLVQKTAGRRPVSPTRPEFHDALAGIELAAARAGCSSRRNPGSRIVTAGYGGGCWVPQPGRWRSHMTQDMAAGPTQTVRTVQRPRCTAVVRFALPGGKRARMWL